MSNCKNCNHPATENFCSNCGQPVKLKRIDSHYIVHEITHVLHLEKGIFYTIKELLLRPGENVKAFISENRIRLIKPVIFIIITSLIYSITIHFFHIDDGYVKTGGSDIEKSTFIAISKWIQDHYGYANILMGMFIAFWLSLFFKKYGYNLFEIVILLCFAMGMGMLIFAVFALLEGITKIHFMQVSGILGVGYCSWAIGQFFDKRKVASYLKALGAYLLGMITFWLSAFLVGAVFDLMFKH